MTVIPGLNSTVVLSAKDLNPCNRILFKRFTILDDALTTPNAHLFPYQPGKSLFIQLSENIPLQMRNKN
jgi:hypothetical protein